MTSASRTHETYLSWKWFLLFGVAFAIFGTKLQLIRDYGSQIPFVDQWEGEAMRLYRPWLRNELTLRDLFASHYEHRIFFTRILDLFVLTLNGQWDSRVLMVVQALLPVAFSVFLIRAAICYLSSLQAWLFAIVVVLFFSSNVSYGNTLWAFQSGFYFCILFSVLHVGLTFLSKPMQWRWWLGQMCGLANIFTIGSGVLSSLAVALILIWCWVVLRDRRQENTIGLVWSIAVAVIGFFISTNDTKNDALRHIFRPQSVADAGTMVGNMFAWPFSASADSKMWCVVFAPVTVWLVVVTCKNKLSGIEKALTSIAVMVVMQNLIFAIFRGVAWSRYLDTLSLGIIANLACLLYWHSARRLQPVKWIITIVWVVLIVNALFAQQNDFVKRAFPTMKNEHQRDLITIRAIIRGEEIDLSGSAAGYGLKRIKEVVSDAAIRPILPTSLRDPLRLKILNRTEFGARIVSPEEWTMSPWPGFNTYSREAGHTASEFSSQPMDSKFQNLMFLVKGSINERGNSLTLRTQSGRIIYPANIAPISDSVWKSVYFRAPKELFSVIAHAEAGESFEFSEPVEVPVFTRLAEEILKSADVIRWLGIGAITASLALMFLVGKFRLHAVTVNAS